MVMVVNGWAALSQKLVHIPSSRCRAAARTHLATIARDGPEREVVKHSEKASPVKGLRASHRADVPGSFANLGFGAPLSQEPPPAVAACRWLQALGLFNSCRS